MPYISKEGLRREQLQQYDTARNAGELNYQIFYYVKHENKIKKFMIEMFVSKFLGEKKSYQKFNDMTGCLIRCYREIERRLDFCAEYLLEIMDSYDEEINKYEELKCNLNGDVT